MNSLAFNIQSILLGKSLKLHDLPYRQLVPSDR